MARIYESLLPRQHRSMPVFTISDFLEYTSLSRQHEFVVVAEADVCLAEAALGRQSAIIQRQRDELKHQRKLLECACIVIGALFFRIAVRGLRAS